MKIADIKTYVVGNPPPHYEGSNWVFLKITTDDGIEGLGGILEAKKTAGMAEAYYAQSIFPLPHSPLEDKNAKRCVYIT